MLAMVREINASIDQVSAEVDQHLRAEYSARSSSGHVTATVTGAGAVTGIGFDRAWLTRAHHSNVGREITEALQAAYAAAAEHGTQHIVDASPLGRIQRLAQDPVALAQTTRLLG
jgi:DNA-binding protein YbaB